MPTPDGEVIRMELQTLGRKLDVLQAFLAGELGGDGRPGNVHRVLETVAKDVAAIDRTLRGDGGLTGILTRLDRLERADEARTWQVRMLAGVLVSVVVKALVDVIMRIA